VGSNPAVYWMDVSDASFYILNEKEEEKRYPTGVRKKG
jgi:hypothetical protein